MSIPPTTELSIQMCLFENRQIAVNQTRPVSVNIQKMRCKLSVLHVVIDHDSISGGTLCLVVMKMCTFAQASISSHWVPKQHRTGLVFVLLPTSHQISHWSQTQLKSLHCVNWFSRITWLLKQHKKLKKIKKHVAHVGIVASASYANNIHPEWHTMNEGLTDVICKPTAKTNLLDVKAAYSMPTDGVWHASLIMFSNKRKTLNTRFGHTALDNPVKEILSCLPKQTFRECITEGPLKTHDPHWNNAELKNWIYWSCCKHRTPESWTCELAWLELFTTIETECVHVRSQQAVAVYVRPVLTYFNAREAMETTPLLSL